MTDTTDRSRDLDALGKFCRGAPQVMYEGGYTYVALPGLRFMAQGEAVEMTALLVPQQVPALGGYTTRLLLERSAGKPGVNWTTVQVLGRVWHTWSWNNIPSSWPWPEILAAHLKVLA